MNVTEVTKYKSADGKLFDTRHEAEDHNLRTVLIDIVDNATDAPGLPHPALSPTQLDSIANAMMKDSRLYLSLLPEPVEQDDVIPF